MRANTCKGRSLPKGGEIIAEVLASEDPVVGLVLLNDDSRFTGEHFKLVFAEERFVCGEIHLVLIKDQLAGVIEKDCAA
jgi:hypothetical protein